MNYNKIGMYKRPMNFFEKLSVGWYWFGECFSEWCWTMMHPEDTGGYFFCHITCDYCKYKEEMYYNGSK